MTPRHYPLSVAFFPGIGHVAHPEPQHYRLASYHLANKGDLRGANKFADTRRRIILANAIRERCEEMAETG